MIKLWIDDVRPAPEGYDWCKRTFLLLLVCCFCFSFFGCAKQPETIVEYVEVPTEVIIEKIVEVEVPVEKEIIKEIEVVVEKEIIKEVEVIVEKEVEVRHNWIWAESRGECGLCCSICGIRAETSWQEHHYVHTVTQQANCYQNEKTTANCIRCGHTFNYISDDIAYQHNYSRKLVYRNEQYQIENKCCDCGTTFYSYDFDSLCAFVEVRGLSCPNKNLSELSWINLSINIEKGHFSNQLSYTCKLLNNTGIYGEGSGYTLNSIPGFDIVDGKNTIIVIEITDSLHPQTTIIVFSLGDWIQQNKDNF